MNDESANTQIDQTQQGSDEPVQGGVAQSQTTTGASAMDDDGVRPMGAVDMQQTDATETDDSGMHTVAGVRVIQPLGHTDANDTEKTNGAAEKAEGADVVGGGEETKKADGTMTEMAGSEKTDENVMKTGNVGSKKIDEDVRKDGGMKMDDAKADDKKVGNADTDGIKPDDAAKAVRGKTPQEIDDEIMDKFLYGLIDTKGLKSFKGEIRWKVKEDLKALLVEYINVSILNALPEDKLGALSQAVDEGDKEKIGEIFKDAGIDYGKVVGEALIGFGNTYLGEEDGGAGTGK